MKSGELRTQWQETFVVYIPKELLDMQVAPVELSLT